MKRIFITLLVVIGMLNHAFAQQSIINNKPNALFFQGKEMYLHKNYVGASQFLNLFLKESKDPSMVSDAEYYIIASDYYLGHLKSVNSFKEYLDKNPSTIYRNQIYFLLGSSYYSSEDWTQARHWFQQVSVSQLTDPEDNEFYYRYAYVALQEKDYSRASKYFKKVLRVKEYQTSASYYLAYIDFQEKRYQDAEKVFNVLKNKPEYKYKSLFFLTQIAYIDQNYQETIDLANNCLEASSQFSSDEKSELYRLLGSSYYNQGNDTKAFQNYKQMQQLSLSETGIASFPLDNYRLGELYYKNGQYDDAIEQLTKAASGTGMLRQSANMLLGQSYLKQGDNSKALMYFDLAAKADDNPTVSEDALYNYVLLTSKTTDVFGQSIDAFKKFLNKYPNSKYRTELNNDLAQILLSTHDYDLALSTIETLKNPSQSLLEAKQITLYQQGVQFYLSKKYNNAIKKFDQVIDMKDYNLNVKKDAFYWRAEALFQLGNYQEAGQDFLSYTSAVSMSEKNYLPALYNLGYSYFKQKDYNKALSSFSQFVTMSDNKTQPIYGDALSRMGDCYLFRKDYAQALKYYADAMKIPGTTSEYAYFQNAFILGLQKDYTGKVSVLNQLISKYPESVYVPNALFEQSRAYAMMKNDNAAIASAEKLLKGYPQSALTTSALVQVGQLYYNQNKNQQAINAYKKILENYSNTDESTIALSSLEAIYRDLNDINSYVSFVNSLGGDHKITSNRQDTLTFQAAENVFMKGRKAESAKAFENYLSAYPEGRFSSDVNFYLGTIAFDNQNKDQAFDYFNQVIKSNNAKYIEDALIYNSGIVFDRKNYPQAYTFYQQLGNITTNTKNKGVANLGMLRSAYLMKKDKEVIEAANSILADNSISADVVMEANFYKGKSAFNNGDLNTAYKAFEQLAKNTRTEQGSEAKYQLANILYLQKKYDKSIEQINDFIAKGTPFKDWMAKTVLLLADNYKAKGDANQALQYLESLKSNYNGNDEEIKRTITSKINALQVQ